MHSTWTRKTRAWGYDVIRGIDADDPLRVIRAFKHPTELAFVDLNTQVGLQPNVGSRGFGWERGVGWTKQTKFSVTAQICACAYKLMRRQTNRKDEQAVRWYWDRYCYSHAYLAAPMFTPALAA